MCSKAMTAESRTDAVSKSQEELSKRKIVLIVKTTGIDIDCGHRIIEIAAVELLDRSIPQKRLHCQQAVPTSDGDGEIETR